MVWLAALLSLMSQEIDQRAEIERETVRPSVAWVGLANTSTLAADVVEAVSDYVGSQLGDAQVYEVISKKDLRSLIKLEAERQALAGKDDPELLRKIAERLGASRVLKGELGRAGEEYVLTLTLVAADRLSTIASAGRRAPADDLDLLLDQVRPLLLDLLEKDPEPDVNLRAKRMREEGWDDDSSFYVSFGLRADGDVLGKGIGFGVAGTFGWRFIGISAAVFVSRPSRERPVGLRLEGRFHPFQLGPVRPYLAAGTTAYFPEASIRAALGADLTFGIFLIFADVAFEHYPGAAEFREPNAVLISGGVGIEL